MHRFVIYSVLVLSVPYLQVHAQDQPGASGTAAAPNTYQDSVLYTHKIVSMSDGYRATRIIGSEVRNDQGNEIGEIDDLIIRRDDQVVYAVISVGGFLGLGDRLVAVPYQDFVLDSKGRLILPDMTEEALEAMPAFQYKL